MKKEKDYEALLISYLTKRQNLSKKFIDKGYILMPWKEIDILIKIKNENTLWPTDAFILFAIFHYPSKCYYTTNVAIWRIVTNLKLYPKWKNTKSIVCQFCPARKCENRLRNILVPGVNKLCYDSNIPHKGQYFGLIWLYYLNKDIKNYIKKLKGGKK